MKAAANLAVVFVILVWGMTFANTRALLEDFSALEIQFLRFALAWAVLWVWERFSQIGRRSRGDRPTGADVAWHNRHAGGRCRDELLFAHGQEDHALDFVRTIISFGHEICKCMFHARF